MTWTLLELLRWTTGYLADKGVPESRLTTELLLAGTLGVKRLDLYLQYDRPLEADELAIFKERLRRKVRREPLQYIEGRAAFRELELAVDRRVLIPRPETEMLVEEVLRWCGSRSGVSVLDVGTGSGAIALSLAVEGDFGRIVATDVSAESLALARENADRLGLRSVVEFREGSVYEPVAGDRFDVIVSNPPYVTTGESGSLPPEVSGWEPKRALLAGDDGLDIIRKLVAGAPDRMRDGGLLALEIGESQGAAVAALVRGRGGLREPEVRQDLSGRDRFVLAELATGWDYSS